MSISKAGWEAAVSEEEAGLEAEAVAWYVPNFKPQLSQLQTSKMLKLSCHGDERSWGAVQDTTGSLMARDGLKADSEAEVVSWWAPGSVGRGMDWRWIRRRQSRRRGRARWRCGGEAEAEVGLEAGTSETVEAS